MLAPIDFSHVEQTLATPLGWADLGLVAVPRTFCLARRRRVWRAREASGDKGFASRQLRARRPAADRASRSCRSPPVRIIATSGRRSSGRSAPLLIALAAIRMIVYGLRRLFRSQGWVPTSERAIAFAIWGLVDPALPGPPARDRGRARRDPDTHRQDADVAAVDRHGAILVVVFTLIVTLWISGLIEQRLACRRRISTSTCALCSASSCARCCCSSACSFALQAIGFDLTLLSVFGGALGVGIGLGLQKLASQLHRRLHDPARPLDPLGRHGHRRQAATAPWPRSRRVTSSCGASTASKRSSPTRRWSRRRCSTTRTRRATFASRSRCRLSSDSDVERALTLMDGNRAPASARAERSPTRRPR